MGQLFVLFIVSYFLSYYKTKVRQTMERLSKTKNLKCNMVGEKVKQFRIEQGLSQRTLSIKLETEGIYICRGSISRIEDGSRTVTDLELYGLSKVLKQSIDSFFYDYPS